MPSAKSRPIPQWSMYPGLHEDVLVLLAEAGLHFDFHEADDERCIKAYDTNIMGLFTCRNDRCRTNAWTSKRIAIHIRMYRGRKYNARVYNQRCRECNQIGKPRLTDSYAERVAYRLKKWSGLEVETPKFAGKSKAPHRSELCEGCKAGHCSSAV